MRKVTGKKKDVENGEGEDVENVESDDENGGVDDGTYACKLGCFGIHYYLRC